MDTDGEVRWGCARGVERGGWVGLKFLADGGRGGTTESVARPLAATKLLIAEVRLLIGNIRAFGGFEDVGSAKNVRGLRKFSRFVVQRAQRTERDGEDRPYGFCPVVDAIFQRFWGGTDGRERFWYEMLLAIPLRRLVAGC